MAANTNEEVGVTLGPTAGLKIGNIFHFLLSGLAQTPGVFRGFGGPIANTTGGHTSSPHLHLGVTETYDDEWDYGEVALSTSASRVDNIRGNGASVSVMTYRKSLAFQNKHSSINVFIGKNSSVTTSGSNIGFLLEPGAILRIPLGTNLTVYAIAASGTPTLGVFQFA